jgi:single-strand DNA-binding protein
MKSIGLARLGRDAEVRYLPDGTAVANLSLAVNYGKKGSDGNRPTQWIDASLWGKQAEAIAQYLVKGSVHSFTLSDVHIETYQRNGGGEGFKMVARVDDVELGPRVGGGDNGFSQDQQPRQAAGQQRATQQRQAPQPMDDSEDIPF